MKHINNGMPLKKIIKQNRETDTNTDLENKIFMRNRENWSQFLVVELLSEELHLQVTEVVFLH